MRVALLWLLVGCASETSTPSRVVDADAATDSAPAIPASSYDCRAIGVVRKSRTPHACVTDPSCKSPMISSHRGAGAPGMLAPENTLSAIRASIAVGADVVETDIRKTADGQLVLFHDATVERTLEGKGSVASLTLAELRAMKMRVSGYDGDFSCERVPTLIEALALARDNVQLILDASKIDDTEGIVAAVQRADAVTRVVIDSELDPNRLKRALAVEPKIHVAVRAKTPTALDAALADIAPQLPIWVHINDAAPSSIVPTIRAKGLRAFSLAFVADAVTSLEDPFVGARYRELYDGGVTFLQTNRPELVVRVLPR